MKHTMDKNKRGFRAVAAGALALLACAATALAGDYSTWARYRVVNVNTTAMTLSGSVTNIPVLVRFNAASHRDMLDSATQILAGGADVRVTLADGTTDVPFEIETATTGASGALSLWVKAPSVAQNSATAATFRVYWGKTGATTMSAPTAVFDTAQGFLAVWHLNEAIVAAGDTIRDVTAGNNKGVAGVFGTGAVVPYDTAGISGVAKKINATSNTVGGFFEILDADSSLSVNTDVGPYSISAWANVTTCANGSRSAVISKYNNTNDGANVQFRQFALQTSSSNNLWRLTNNPPSLGAPLSGINEFGADGTCTINQWTHLVGSYFSAAPPTADAAGSAAVKLYVNGSGVYTNITATQTNTQIGRSAPIFIGKLMDNQRFLRGAVDEVRMAKVARDSNWAEVEYETQRPAGGTAVTISATLTPGVVTVPGAPTGVAGVAGDGQVTVSWSAPASDGGGAITGYLARATQDTTKSCSWTTGTLSCTVTGLTNGTSYTFVVRASNSAGNGAFSAASAGVAPSAIIGFAAGRRIVLNTSGTGANVPGPVYNFPVLVRLGSTESAILSAANGGASIRFLKADSATVIPHEIESWSSTAAAIWVKVDTILGNNATQRIHMIWGKSGAVSTSNGPAVFDSTKGFVAVWHLGDATNQTDATGRGNTGTASAVAPLDSAGLIGRAKAFNGSTNWYQIGANNRALNLSTGGALTISAWANATSCDARIAAFAKYVNGATPAGRQYALHTGNTTTNWRFTIGPPTGADEFFADAEASCVTGTWKHVVGSYAAGATPSADSLRIYVDGAFVASGSTAGVTGLGDSAQAYIGRIHNDQRYMNGLLDEITVSSVRRDSNWIKLAYQNQKLANSLVNIGSVAPPVTVPGAPGAPTATASTATTGMVTLTWTAPASNGNATITAYTATVATGTPVNTCTTTGALTCNITGLTVGSPYTFTVRATNAAGQGPASGASNSVVPVTGINLPGAFVIRGGSFVKPYTYRLPATAVDATEQMTLTVTDTYGRTVWSKSVSPKDDRISEITWNGRNSSGQKVSAGMYVVKVSVRSGGKLLEATQKGVTLDPK
jgi:hypothetical protein